MKNIVFATSGLLAAAFTATIAFGQWTVPLALAPVTVDQNRNVTVDFENAPASEVIAWLKKSGVNFVFEGGASTSGRRLTVHIKNQPMDKVVQAIADAMGMTSTKKGNIYTLKGGSSNWATYSKDWTPQEAEKWAKEFGGQWKEFKPESGKTFQWNEKDFEKLHDGMKWEFKELDKAQMEKLMKDIPKFEWKEGQYKMDKAEMEKLMKELPKMQDFEKMHKFEWNPKDGDYKFKEMDKAELEKLMKELPKMKLDMKEFEKLKEMKGFEWKEMPELKELDKAQLEKLYKDHKFTEVPKIEMEALARAMEAQAGAMSKMKGLGDLDKLMKSLTPAQLEKNKKQGYLTVADLNADQKKLLGDWATKGDMVIQTDKDGVRVTIKSKK